MFKLLISIVMLMLFVVAIAAVVQIILGVQKSKNSLPDDNLPIEDIIEELEFKLMRAEIQAERGVKEAEEKVTLFKSELEKARTIKEKLSK
jgi:hypothetical protein